jgi:hypothetical protein
VHAVGELLWRDVLDLLPFAWKMKMKMTRLLCGALKRSFSEHPVDALLPHC